MKRLLLLTLVLFCFASVQATIYTSVGSGLWTDCTLWTPTCPPEISGPNDTILIIHSIVSNNDLFVGGVLMVRPSGQLTVNGKVKIDFPAVLSNFGRMYITDELHIDGELYNYNYLSADKIHSDGYMCNTDTVVCSPQKYDCHGCVIECGGTTLTCEIKIHNNNGLGRNALVQDQGFCCPDGITPTLIDFQSGTLDSSTVSVCQVPLPLMFVYLNLRAGANTNLLDWAVTSEGGIDRFEVERSVDGLQFSTIGLLVAGSGQSAYDFTDVAPVAQTLFYRVKGVDANGKVNYSKVQSLLNQDVSGITLLAFPNPSSGGQMTVSFGDGFHGDGHLLLLDLSGRQLDDRLIPSGSKSYDLDLAVWPNAMYFIELVADGQRRSLKVIKQD